jgi:hypothetical protein
MQKRVKNFTAKSFKEYMIFSALIGTLLYIFNSGYIFYASADSFGNSNTDIYIDFVGWQIAQFIAISYILFFILATLKKNLAQKLALFILFVAYAYGYIFILELGIYKAGGFANAMILNNLTDINKIIELVLLFLFAGVVYRYYEFLYKKAILLFVILFLFHAIDLQQYNTQYKNTKQQTTIDVNQTDDVKLNFSKNKPNILIIVIDAMPGWQFQKLLSHYPDLNSKLDGFTWYKNSVSNGTYTLVSTPGILGGNSYTMDKLNKKNYKTMFDGIDDAWGMIPNNFKKYDYQYIGEHYLSQSSLNKYNKYNNIEVISSNKAMANYSNNDGSSLDTKRLNNISLFKSMPIFLKSKFNNNNFLGKGEDSISINYNNIKSFYKVLENSITGNSKAPTIKLIWSKLDTIRPLSLNENCAQAQSKLFNKYGTKEMEWSINCHINALDKMFIKMKKDGYYNNSKIIIVSDHGSYKYGHRWHNYSIFPFLAVKDFNQRGNLKISNKAMMNSDVLAIACNGADSCKNVEKDPRFSDNPNRKRIFNVTLHGNKSDLINSKFPITYQIEVVGDVYDKKNWNKINNK